MKLGDFDDYKRALRARLKDSTRTAAKGLTLKRIAERIAIQYTYLSKVMNDPEIHLSEDHVFEIARILGFPPHEIDYLLLLRAHQTAKYPARKREIALRIDRAREGLGVSAAARAAPGAAADFTNEMNYLFDPFASIVRVALYVPQFRQDPKRLGSPLGITMERLRGILKNLALIGFIETGGTAFQIVKVHPEKLHFGKEHPLMRMHQYLSSIACQNALLKGDDADVENVQVKFTADENARRKIRTEFRKFLKVVEEIAGQAPNESLYQLNFQLFNWL